MRDRDELLQLRAMRKAYRLLILACVLNILAVAIPAIVRIVSKSRTPPAPTPAEAPP